MDYLVWFSTISKWPIGWLQWYHLIPPLSNLSLNECVNDATWVFNLLADWKSDHLVQFLNLRLEVRSLFFGERSNSPLKRQKFKLQEGRFFRGFKQEEHVYIKIQPMNLQTLWMVQVWVNLFGAQWGPKINVSSSSSLNASTEAWTLDLKICWRSNSLGWLSDQ